jgi:hypothetical protein
VGRLVAVTLAILLGILVSCTRESPPSTPVTTDVQARPKLTFVPPTAEEAYRLQDDCTRRGEKILKENIIGNALAHEQVSRYNPTTNRCYVRLQVHAADLSEWEKHDTSTYFYDGQTGEMLAYFVVKTGGAQTYLGFGCTDFFCVSGKVGDCMSSKECEP